MHDRDRNRIAAAIFALTLALPASAAVRTAHPFEPSLRPELINTEPPLSPTSAGGAALLESPHAEQAPAPGEGRDDGGTRIDLPGRHESIFEDLLFERDGRANPDGSPRLKDLNPGSRRR